MKQRYRKSRPTRARKFSLSVFRVEYKWPPGGLKELLTIDGTPRANGGICSGGKLRWYQTQTLSEVEEFIPRNPQLEAYDQALKHSVMYGTGRNTPKGILNAK